MSESASPPWVRRPLWSLTLPGTLLLHVSHWNVKTDWFLIYTLCREWNLFEGKTLSLSLSIWKVLTNNWYSNICWINKYANISFSWLFHFPTIWVTFVLGNWSSQLTFSPTGEDEKNGKPFKSFISFLPWEEKAAEQCTLELLPTIIEGCFFLLSFMSLLMAHKESDLTALKI